MFANKSLNARLTIINELKNSTGKNNMNNAMDKVITVQKNPCPFQVIKALLMEPIDSKNK